MGCRYKYVSLHGFLLFGLSRRGGITQKGHFAQCLPCPSGRRAVDRQAAPRNANAPLAGQRGLRFFLLASVSHCAL